LLAVINSSSLLIALPDIFRGIHLDPLNSSNFAYLLWILMGYGMVVAALVVTAGRIGDMYGRVRLFKIGLVLFTVTAVVLTLIWSTGPTAALEIVILRMVQAIGGAMLMANSAAILTDAFPHNQRGLALGIYGLGLLAGSFVGLILGGVLATVYWRLVFAVNVPIGLIAIVFAFWKLHDFGERHPARIDWPGNILFASALGMILTGVTYGIKPYHGANVGWANPFVLTVISIGVVLLAVFFFIETQVKDPMFNLKLFRIRAFAAGNLAVVLSSVANGGMQFLLIMWLQGIWLPLHGYSFEKTPLWAGIFMLPLTLGYLCAAPISGGLSDRYGARPFATAGMALGSISFLLLLMVPADFTYWMFALVIFINGLAFGLFSTPNTAAIMNSVPAHNRGVASGMRATCQMLGQPLSIGIFFSLMVVGLSSSVPAAMIGGLTAHQVSVATATQLAHMPPTAYLFAAFLGYNPIQQLLGQKVLSTLPAGQANVLVSKHFFPSLLSGPFIHGVIYVLIFAACMCAIAAIASLMRGRKFVHEGAMVSHNFAEEGESE
jgi:MFS family permease